MKPDEDLAHPPGHLALAKFAGRRCRAAMRTAPLTTAYLLWLALAAVLMHLVPPAAQEALDAALVRPGSAAEAPWTPLTSLLLPSSPLDPPVTPALVWNLIALAVLGPPAERLLRRPALLAGVLLGQVGATVLTGAFGAAFADLFPHWSLDIESTAIAGPAVGYLAAAAAATSCMPRLWRRRLRVTGATILVTAVLYHGGSVSLFAATGAGVGLAFGELAIRRRRPEVNPRGSLYERRVLVALVVAASGVGPLIGATLGFGDGPLSVLGAFIAAPDPEAVALIAEGCPVDASLRDCAALRLTLDPNPGLLLLTCVPTALLLVAALGLRRGRRSAWWLAVAVQSVLGVFFVETFAGVLLAAVEDGSEIDAGDVVTVVLPCLAPIVVITVLIRAWGRFAVASPPGMAARLVARVAAALVALPVAYVLGGLAVADQWTDPATAGQLLADAPRRLVPLEYLLPLADAFPALLPVGPAATALYSWVGVLTWLAIILALLVSLARRVAATAEIARARDILVRNGGSSLAWMGLWEGNLHWFSADGSSYVAYRRTGGIVLTTGDPVGPAETADAVLEEFLAFADHQGWTVCFYSATEELADALAGCGWERVQIAEEAVLDLPDLAFKGKRFQDVRTAFNHARRDGLRTHWTTWDELSVAQRLQIREISAAWVAEQTLPEMGFTLGGLQELDDPDVRLLLCLDAEGRIEAVASWLPIHRDGARVGWTLDFMRRRPEGFRFAMEVLIGQAALDLQAEGYVELSLSGAPLARAAELPPPRGFGGALTSVLDRLGRSLEPVYGFRSLLRFKSKFQPRYRSLWLVYPDPAVLPAIGRAVATAYLSDSPLEVAWSLRGQLRGPGS